MVTTEHKKWLKWEIKKKYLKTNFLPKGIRSLGRRPNPPQELEEGLPSGRYLLVKLVMIILQNIYNCCDLEYFVLKYDVKWYIE